MGDIRHIVGVLLNPFASNAREFLTVLDVEEGNLDFFYEHLHCDLIDIVRRNIDGENVCIVCDDEGLFKEDNKPAIILNYEGLDTPEIIVGRCLITGLEDDEGILTDLPFSSFQKIISHVAKHRDREGLFIFADSK